MEAVTTPYPVLSWGKGFSAGILEQSMGVRNLVGIGFSYRPAKDSLESIPRLLKSLKIPSLLSVM
jgi:hypothetical protein